jgi:hypothetical protein
LVPPPAALISINDFGHPASLLHRNGLFPMQCLGLPINIAGLGREIRFRHFCSGSLTLASLDHA